MAILLIKAVYRAIQAHMAVPGNFPCHTPIREQETMYLLCKGLEAYCLDYGSDRNRLSGSCVLDKDKYLWKDGGDFDRRKIVIGKARGIRSSRGCCS